MAANFPDSPSNGQTFTSGALTFTWNGSAWKLDPSSGTKGEKGQKGEVGVTGDKGQKGEKGEIGDKGQKGEIGATGGSGGTGIKGQKGEVGEKGIAGAAADKGQKGEVGDKGDTGGVGSSGDKGDKGAPSTVAGDKGQKGEIGSQGTGGSPGAAGDKGQKGEEGPQGGGAPVGQIVAWSGSAGSLPSGYFLCDGSAISRTTYAALFTVVGTTHGAGNGSSTFNIPDLRDRFILGASNSTGDTSYPGVSPGATGGSADATLVSHSHTINNHTHSFSANTNNPGDHDHRVDVLAEFASTHGTWQTGGGYRQVHTGGTHRKPLTSDAGGHTHSISGTTGNPSNTGTNSQGSSSTNANLPPYYALAYIIQYAQGGTTAKGQKGEVGAQGSGGSAGDKGQKGEAGDKGAASSVQGPAGDKGQKGEVGAQGSGGSAGTKGQKGEVGAQGSGGSAGSDGDKGQKGEVGAGGDKGQKGEINDKGQKGEAGSSGSIGGSANQVVYKNSSNVATGSNNLTFNGSMLKTNGTISVGAGHPTSNFYSGADDLVVANFAQDTGISIMSGTSNEANVAFGSTTFGSGAIQARLYYDSGNDKFVMNTLTTGHDIEIKSAGTITLGDLNNPTITIDDMTASGSNYGVEVDGTIYPKITGAAHSYRDLGLSGVRWTNVYATNLHGDGSNITNVSNTPARKVRTATLGSYSLPSGHGSWTNAVSIGSFTPNSTNSVFLVNITIGNFLKVYGAGAATGQMRIVDATDNSSIDGVDTLRNTADASGSHMFTLIDLKGGTTARNYAIQLNSGNNSGRPRVDNVRIMVIEMDTSI